MTRQKRLDLPGRSLALDCSGPAPDLGVLLLHGYGSSREGTKVQHFTGVLDRRGTPWAALDFTAHGDSTGHAHELCISRLVDDVGEAIDHLREEAGWTGRVVLSGKSLGGVTAAWAAAERVTDAAALFLVAPAVRLVDRLLPALEPDERERWESTGRMPRVHRGWEHELGWVLVSDWQQRDHDAMPARLDMPITLVHGHRDDRVPLVDAQRFVEAAPNARLVEVEDGDHRLHEHLDLLGRELNFLLDSLA